MSLEDLDDLEIDNKETESVEEQKRDERFSRVKSDSLRLKKTQSTKIANISIFKINDDITKLEEETRLEISNTSEYVLDPTEQYYIKKNKLYMPKMPVRSNTNKQIISDQMDKFIAEIKKDEKKVEDEKEVKYVKRFDTNKSVKFSTKKVVYEYNDDKTLPDFVPKMKAKSNTCSSKFNIGGNIPKLPESSDNDSESDDSLVLEDELTEKELEKLKEIKKKREEQEIAKKIENEERQKRKEETEKILSEEKLNKKSGSKSSSSGKSNKSNSSSNSKKKKKKK